MKRRVFYLLNQNPLDGDVHSLYCVRHVLSLARNAPPGWEVVLLHASFSGKEDIFALHEVAGECPLKTWGLPSVKRSKRCPFQINAVFHLSGLLTLRCLAKSGDIVTTASFPELFRFIGARLGPNRPRLVYEVHQLESLSRSEENKKCLREYEALGLADALMTTCLPLEKILSKKFPKTPLTNLGLASTYGPANNQSGAREYLRLGYFGSISEEQGIPWLVTNWAEIRRLAEIPHELHIYGRARRGEISPKSDPASGVFVYQPIPSNEVPAACAGLDALVIPSLDLAHRASIAFTKAYDFAGLALPIISCDLPTIKEVLDAEKHALYFSPGSVEGIAKVIRRLQENPSLRKEMSENLKVRSAFFSWDQRATRWWSAFAE